MRQLNLTLTLPEDVLHRKRQARRPRSLLAVGLVLAALWLLSGPDLDPDAVDFGTVPSRVVRTLPVKLTNRGVREMRPSRIAVEGRDALEFTLLPQTCESVPASSACTVEVTFHSGEPGAKRAELVVEVAEGQRVISELSALTLSPDVSVTPPSLAFGEVPANSTSEARIVRVSGQPGLALKNVEVSEGGSGYEATASPCDHLKGTTICPIAVRFAPDGEGDRSAVLKITENLTTIVHEVPLTATGKGPPPAAVDAPPPTPTPPPPSPPSMGVTPLALEFANDTEMKEVQVANTGAGAWNVAAALQGDSKDHFEIAGNGCGGTIEPNQSCIISLKFKIKWGMWKNSYKAKLQIAPGNSQIPAKSVALVWERQPLQDQHSGTPPPSALEPHVTISPDPVDLSPRPGITANRTVVTLVNNGQVPLPTLQLLVQPSNSPFAVSGECRSLAMNEKCQAIVSFSQPHSPNQHFEAKLYVYALGQAVGDAKLIANIQSAPAGSPVIGVIQQRPSPASVPGQ